MFFSAARGQTAGPILTSNISKRVFLRLLHSFVSENNDITITVGRNPQNIQKLARIGIFQPKCQNLITAISPKQLSPIMFGIDGIAHRWFHSPRGGLGWTCPPHFCQRPFLRLMQIRRVFLEGDGSSQRSSLAKNVSFCSAPPFTCLLEWNLCGS